MFSIGVKFFKTYTGKLTIGVPGQHTVYLFGEFSLKGLVQLETMSISEGGHGLQYLGSRWNLPKNNVSRDYFGQWYCGVLRRAHASKFDSTNFEVTWACV